MHQRHSFLNYWSHNRSAYRFERMLVLIGLCLSLTILHGEKYQTAEEARARCFPTADSFEDVPIKPTLEQKRSIEKELGSRIFNSYTKASLARKSGKLIGYFLTDSTPGKHQLIDFSVAIDGEGRVIQIDILEYRESHGHEIRSEKWRKQFNGKTVQHKFRLNEDIYNLSGATISSRSVSLGVKKLLIYYNHLLRSGLPSALPVVSESK